MTTPDEQKAREVSDAAGLYATVRLAAAPVEHAAAAVWEAWTPPATRKAVEEGPLGNVWHPTLNPYRDAWTPAVRGGVEGPPDHAAVMAAAGRVVKWLREAVERRGLRLLDPVVTDSPGTLRGFTLWQDMEPHAPEDRRLARVLLDDGTESLVPLILLREQRMEWVDPARRAEDPGCREWLWEPAEWTEALLRVVEPELRRVGKGDKAEEWRATESPWVTRGRTTVETGIPWLLRLGWLAWLVERADRAEGQRRRAAVIRDVAAHGFQALQGELGVDGAVTGVSGEVIGYMTGGLSSRDVELLRCVPAQRLFRRLVHTVQTQQRRGGQDWRRVVFEGGQEALSNEFGRVRSNGGKAGWLDVLRAGQHFEIRSALTDAGGLWTHTVRRGGPGKPGQITIVAGELLTAQIAPALPGRTQPQREARRLVPVPAAWVPDDAVDPAKRAAAWNLHWQWLVVLVERAAELARDGGMVMTTADWQRLAQRAGFPVDDLDRLLAHWLEGESDKAPAALAVVDGRIEGPRALVTLPEAYAAELAFIVEGGRKRTHGAAGGRKSAARVPGKRKR